MFMEEIVHIIPLGYEIDRVVKPFEAVGGYRPNRVYVLSSIHDVEGPREVIERHERYALIVKEKLESLNIDVILVPTNLINILELIQKISRITREEKEKGNIVYINMSGAGRLTSVASTLSGMVHDVKVYYVESDGYADDDPRMEERGYTLVDEPRVMKLENFQINMPDEAQLKALVKIMVEGRMRTIDLIEYLGSEGFSDYDVNYYGLSRNDKSAVIMKLNRNIIDKLSEKGYINKIKLGRENEYEVTETGKYVASISGLLP